LNFSSQYLFKLEHAVPGVDSDLDVVPLFGVGFAGCPLHKGEAATRRWAHERLLTCTQIKL
jgi:hypothetical protein